MKLRLHVHPTIHLTKHFTPTTTIAGERSSRCRCCRSKQRVQMIHTRVHCSSRPWSWCRRRRKTGRLRGTRTLEITESGVRSGVRALKRPKSLIRFDRTFLLCSIHRPRLRREGIYGAERILLLPHGLCRGRRRHAHRLHRPATNPVPTRCHGCPGGFRERARHAAHREGRAVGARRLGGLG